LGAEWNPEQSCPFVHIAFLVRCSLASVAAGFSGFCPQIFLYFLRLFSSQPAIYLLVTRESKETKRSLKDANTVGVPLYCGWQNGNKKTKINGNIRVGINSL